MLPASSIQIPMNSLPITVRTQVIGSCCGEGVLRAEVVVFARVVDTRLAEAVRAEGDPDRPEDPLPWGLPEAPLDVRVAMVGRLARRMVYRAETRRERREACPNG